MRPQFQAIFIFIDEQRKAQSFRLFRFARFGGWRMVASKHLTHNK